MQLDEFDIYPGFGNSVDLVLTDNDVPIVHTDITRLQVHLGAQVFDSQAQPGLFDLTHTGYVSLKLGAASLSLGRHHARLVVFDSGEYSGGLVWPEQFVVNVRSP